MVHRQQSPAAFTTFGSLLRYLRQRARLTQIDLAIATGYSTGQISRLEQNQRLPNPSAVQALFLPVLALEDAPELAERLLELAHTAHQPSLPADAAAPSAAAPALLPSVPLLVTKLFVPRPRANLVRRPRLLRRLDAALTLPLTVVAAPAGFGKTSLLADWLSAGAAAATEPRATAPAVAWLALDEGDNDPATFVRYLIAALQTVLPHVGRAIPALLDGPQPPEPGMALRLLLNDLPALPHETVLVLDDYHLLTAPTIHTALTALLEHLPPQLHLVLATRADPALPLARLRARGHVLELRAADLRFSPDEASQFLGDVMGLVLDPADIAALEARTEGWIAGLQLAALAMRDRGDVSGFISAFAGSNRFVVDYLVAEVVERQPRHIQTFLLHTAVLERMCGSLCDAVLGVEEMAAGGGAPYTQALLEDLERANLFVVPLDDARRWYRYHHLFGEVLRERLLSGAAADEVAQLNLRASAWFARQGMTEEAIQYALAANAPDVAAGLIEAQAEALLIASEMATLRRWIERLPEELVHSRHRLALAYAGARLIIGDIAAVEPLLAAAERAPSRHAGAALAAPGSGDTGWLDDVPNNVRLLRGIVARAVNDLPRAIQLGRAALESLPDQFVFVRSSVAWNLGMAYWSSGDLDAAGEAFGEVWADNQAPDQVYLLSAAATSLGQLRIIQGRLHEAAQLYRLALAGVSRASVPVPGAAMLYVGLADILRERNQLGEAADCLSAALELATQFANLDVLAAAYAIRARIQQAQGDVGAAAATLSQAEAIMPGAVFDVGSAQRARAHLAVGDSDAAEAWAVRAGVGIDTPLSYGHEAEHVILARVLLAQGAAPEALRLLERLAQAAELGGRSGTLVELRVLQAEAHQALGDPSAAQRALEDALARAEPEGYVRIFVDEGAPLQRLLARVRAAAAATHSRTVLGYLERLLAAFTDTPPQARLLKAPGAERLSERELEVLRLVADGLSNQAIAVRLVVGVSTVKKHINNIFGKLGVESRTQALVRAHELDLL